MKSIMHLITQRDQPYGSERKCCEKCGIAIWNIHGDDGYVEYESDYTKDFADQFDAIRCIDKGD